MTQSDENVKFLAGSPNRVEVLDSLTSSPRSVRDLRDALDIPRTTLQKNIRELEEKRWIEKTKSGYVATTVGEICIDEYKRCRDNIETATELEPFLKWVPRASIEDVTYLKGAEITTPAPPNPLSTEEKIIESLSGQDTIRVATPIFTPMVVDELYEMFTDAEVEAEFILEDDVIEAFEDDYTDILETVREYDFVESRVYDGDLPFVLIIVDHKVVLAANDDQGITRALLETDSDEAVDWAERLYESYVEDSERFV